jgi:hypothetical protein
VRWKEGTSDTVELPVKDSVMAITDEDYFDWPVLPEAPSSLNAVLAGGGVRLTWQVHGGNRTGIGVERRIEDDGTRGPWVRIAKLGPDVNEYIDSELKNRRRTAYRVRAVNAGGESAYSNIARWVVP